MKIVSLTASERIVEVSARARVPGKDRANGRYKHVKIIFEMTTVTCGKHGITDRMEIRHECKFYLVISVLVWE